MTNYIYELRSDSKGEKHMAIGPAMKDIVISFIKKKKN